jgi:hypothetical protein
MKAPTVVIKGVGEMATGIAYRLYMANIGNIVMLEIPQPLAVRRTVAFCESIRQRQVDVESIKGVFAVPSPTRRGLLPVVSSKQCCITLRDVIQGHECGSCFG